MKRLPGILALVYFLGTGATLAGCHKEEPVANAVQPTAPPSVAQPATGAKPSFGAVPPMTPRPAPTGAETGNFAGGRK